MTKDELAQLYSEISGGTGLVGEEAFELRQNAENRVGQALLGQYWGLIHSGDAYHQFYLDTLRELAGRLTAMTPSQNHYFFGASLVLDEPFSRFARSDAANPRVDG
ncbi:MAG: hypothetical protein FJ245_05760 [Nitrospira sp.]|nr:hypothetical protein [Nitrospira sp.]